MPSTMNDLAAKTFDYLLVAGHPERRQALRDLSATGAFSSQFEGDTRYYIDRYLKDNPRGFCDEGIAKFKAFLDPPKVAKIEVTLEFEVEGANEDFGINSGSDQGVVYDLVHKHLEGLSILDGKVTLRNVEFSDYTASKSSK